MCRCPEPTTCFRRDEKIIGINRKIGRDISVLRHENGSGCLIWVCNAISCPPRPNEYPELEMAEIFASVPW